MASIIILGDPHIGGHVNIGKIGIGGHLNSKIVDQINLLDWTLDQAIEHHVKDIIITGDIFEDPKPHPSLISIFISWLKKCQAYGVYVHIIMGNHDLLRSGGLQISSLDLISEIDLDNVSVYKEINTIYIDTTAITLIPFRDRKYFGTSSCEDALSILKDVLNYESSEIPITYTKIAVGHLAIKGSIPVGNEIDDLTNELFCDEDFFKNYDYVWMGHVHKPQILKKSKPYLSHIGSMDFSNFTESDHNKFIIIFDCVEKKFNSITLPNRPLKQISILVPKDIIDTNKYVLEQLSKNSISEKSIVRVEISLESPDQTSIDKTSVEDFLLKKGVYNVSGITESKKISLIKKDSSNNINNKMDVLSAIKNWSQANIDEESRSDYIELATEVFLFYKNESKE